MLQMNQELYGANGRYFVSGLVIPVSFMSRPNLGIRNLMFILSVLYPLLYFNIKKSTAKIRKVFLNDD